MRSKLCIIVISIVLAITMSVPAQQPAADTDASPAAPSDAAYALKKDQIDYYESLLRKEVHTSRIDFVAAANILPGDDMETHFAGSILLRPFVTQPLLAGQIIRDYRLYRETAAQTGRPLSDATVTEMERIVGTVEAYRTRPFWKRVVVQVGANVPYDPLQSEAVDTRFFATAGYEVDERIVVAAGSTVGNDPRFVISAGFTIGSDLYAASYASMERLERVFTDRRIYQSVDHYAIETR